MKPRALIAIAAAWPCVSASAQPFEIVKSTIDCGGGISSGGTLTLSGTIGQHDAGRTMTGGEYELAGGFWAGSPTPSARLCADQNSDGAVTPTDFTAWISNFNANELRADVNQDGAVTSTDFTAWIAAFNQGAQGPVCNP